MYTYTNRENLRSKVSRFVKSRVEIKANLAHGIKFRSQALTTTGRLREARVEYETVLAARPDYSRCVAGCCRQPKGEYCLNT